MGIPYSRQINHAFEQVTPLVASGFQVLQTTQNVTVLLAVIQVLTVLCLWLILLALVGVIISVNSDLRHERDVLVTPVMRVLCSVSLRLGSWILPALGIVSLGILIGGGAGLWYTAREGMEVPAEGPGTEDGEGENGKGGGQEKEREKGKEKPNEDVKK